MVSKDNVLIVAVATITITVVGALLSDVFSPASENIKDALSRPPNTTIWTHMTFDSSRNNVSKDVEEGDTIPSRAIEFKFNSSEGGMAYFLFMKYSLLPSNSSSVYECSFDGSPYEECLSPKHYANLQTEQGHIFKVRAKGILGNVDKSPAYFRFISVTSSSVPGVIYNFTSAVRNASIWMDPEKAVPGPNTTTNEMGRFFFTGIGEGPHDIKISPNDGDPRKYSFFVPPAAERIEELNLNLSELAKFSSQVSPITEENKNEQNPNYDKTNGSDARNYTVSIVAQSERTSKGNDTFHTDVWLNTSEATLPKIDHVTYYLHPTFTPDTVTIYTPKNKFGLSFTNWGFFLLKAKVYFKDNTIKNLELPRDKWMENIGN